MQTLARVGKKATLSEIQCNDEKKTFLQSRKEDLFFHARESPELSLSLSVPRSGGTPRRRHFGEKRKRERGRVMIYGGEISWQELFYWPPLFLPPPPPPPLTRRYLSPTPTPQKERGGEGVSCTKFLLFFEKQDFPLFPSSSIV